MATVLLSTADLKPGMITAEGVCSDKQVILQENTILTRNVISRLATWHVHNVRIRQEPRYTGGAESISRLDTEFVQENPAFFQQYGKAVTTAGGLFHHMREQQTVPFKELNQLAAGTLHHILRSKNILSNLYLIKSYTDYTFLHSVDVAILSGLLAVWFNLPEEEVKTLILCGLLHDIGKSQIPLSILDKPSKLTVEERKTITLHPGFGYYMTQKHPRHHPGRTIRRLAAP